MSTWENNLEVLKDTHPSLYNRVVSLQFSQIRLQVIDAKNKSKTVKVCVTDYGSEKEILMHSRYNPQLEAEKFALGQMKEQKKVVVLYGFGFGYNVEAMASQLIPGNELQVYDTNLDVFVTCLQHRDLTGILNRKDVKLYISDELGEMSKYLSKALDNLEQVHIVIHNPSVTAMHEGLAELKFLLNEVNLQKSVSQEYNQLLQQNFILNKQVIKQNVGLFFNRFKGIPTIIVCAGPSLDKNKHLLKGLSNKAIIICVGHALKSLIKIGVRPHFIITIDPLDIVYKQVEGLEDLDIPFILMATAAPINAKKYNGPKFIACQSISYLEPGQEDYLVKTGGSVSTTALDISIKMGGNPIIFIGQDLAFSDQKHHCDETFHENVNQKYLANMRMVKGINGEYLPTTLGMISFNRWIQTRVRDEKDIVFINATEGGAYIEGFRHMSFREAIGEYLVNEFDINENINNLIHKYRNT